MDKPIYYLQQQRKKQIPCTVVKNLNSFYGINWNVSPLLGSSGEIGTFWWNWIISSQHSFYEQEKYRINLRSNFVQQLEKNIY